MPRVESRLSMLIDLDHVQLACPRGAEDVARAFYGTALGLTEVEKPDSLKARGGCWFRIGSRQLHLGVEDPFRPASKAHPAFAVVGIKSLFERLTESGISCVWDDLLPGVERFYTSDPWGNRLEFLELNSEFKGPMPCPD